MFIFFLFSVLIVSFAADDNSQFLFQHADICGDPFSDPMWIPVLDLCTIECNSLKDYCVENDDLEQMCKKMPDACQVAFSDYLRAKWTKGEGLSGRPSEGRPFRWHRYMFWR